MGHDNVDLLRRIDDAQTRGDMNAFFDQFTEDLVVHVGGHNSMTGDYKGLDQFQGLFEKFMERVGEYSFENHTYLADDEHGVTMQRAIYVKDGNRTVMDEVFVTHFRDGKVSEMWFLAGDQRALDELIG